MANPCDAKKVVTRRDLLKYNLFKGLTFAFTTFATIGLMLNPELAASINLPFIDSIVERLPVDTGVSTVTFEREPTLNILERLSGGRALYSLDWEGTFAPGEALVIFVGEKQIDTVVTDAGGVWRSIGEFVAPLELGALTIRPIGVQTEGEVVTARPNVVNGNGLGFLTDEEEPDKEQAIKEESDEEEPIEEESAEPPTPEATAVFITISGQLIDAATGGPLVDGTVCLQGTAQCATSDADGIFLFTEVPDGTEVVLEGSADGYFSATVTAAETTNGTVTQNISLSPELTAGEIRIVLTWNTARDVDSYLRVPPVDDNGAKYLFYNDKGSAESFPFAVLDVDNREGFGPETTTIESRQSGTYAFIVHDYSNRSTPEAATLADAVVQLYSGDGLIAEYTGPAETALHWHVFNIDGETGGIVPIDAVLEDRPNSQDAQFDTSTQN